MKPQLAFGASMFVSLLIVCSGCGKSTFLSGIPVRESPGGSRLSSLDCEAAQEAVNLWKPARIGESVYVCQIEPPFLSRKRPKKTIFELREPGLQVCGSSGSKADNLNGIEWEGEVLLYAKLARSWCDVDCIVPVQPANSWSPWQDVVENQAVHCLKRNGKWDVRISMIGNHPTVFSEGNDISATNFKGLQRSDIP